MLSILFILVRIPRWIHFYDEINENLLELSGNSITFKYQNKSYPIVLKSGTYKLEAYGASGGSGSSPTTARDPQNPYKCLYDDEYVKQLKGNTKCNITSSQAGSGGYASGIIKLFKDTKVFIVVGSRVNYETTRIIQGGFNGGGNAISDNSNPGGSGGGSVDFRVDKDDPFHRILVAGGGGGADNAFGDLYLEDDGSGGSGGLPAQGYWQDGIYIAEMEANSTFGYSFFQGESAILADIYEYSGAGGGFFGGFASHNLNAGGSGGSSFALSKSIPIPSGELIIKHIDRTEERGYYAFKYNSPYLLHNVQFATGIWFGDGPARITYISSFTQNPKFYQFLKKFRTYI